MTKRENRNYVNNADFLEAIVEHKRLCQDARDKGIQLPQVSNYLGECIQSISHRLATKPNFSGYSFKDDMIMDGIENCLLYIENFDTDKSSNPFAYFTQIIYFAFLRRIAKEKKQLYTKLKSSQSMITLGETYTDGGDVRLHMNLDTDYIDNFIQDYEDKVQRDKDRSQARKDAKAQEESE